MIDFAMFWGTSAIKLYLHYQVSFYTILMNFLQRISVSIILLLRCNDLSFPITYVSQ